MVRAALVLGFVVWVGAPAAGEDAHAGHLMLPAGPEAPSAPALENLARATTALDRFQDVEAAEAAGYLKPGNNDGFEMGEHWYRPDLLEDPVCRLEAPQFLQYLVIDGRRRLIGTGYVCDARVGAPDWFGQVAWHQHGPELCRTRKGAVLDASYWAAALPNEVNEDTWQDVCDRFWSKPEERTIVMLHTWNWIATPDGPFVHENRAIPFLRAGLGVPARDVLDSDAGRDALEALRLAQGDLRRRWQGAFLAAGAGLWHHFRVGRAFRRAEKQAAAQVERMRGAEHGADAAAWGEAARAGAALGPAVEAEVAALLDGPERAVAARFLASLVVHDHGGM